MFNTDSTSVICESIVFECPQVEGRPRLKMAVKRYANKEGDSAETGITLLLAHCIGSHKELWEPTIHEIFKLQGSKPQHLRIREAYAFDRQNHGDSALLNEEALNSREDGVSSKEWASSIAAFVNRRLGGRRLFGIGHSAGSVCVSILTQDVSPESFVGNVLVEPMIISQKFWDETGDARIAVTTMLANSIAKRRDTWVSKDAAYNWLKQKEPWSTWDERILRIHVDQGFYHPNPTSAQVKLKTPRKQEALSYPDGESCVAGMVAFDRVHKRIPFHLIYGKDGNIIDDLLKEEQKNRGVASVDEVEDAGHLLVQDNPIGLAHSICRAIDSSASTPRNTTKTILSRL